MLKIRNMGYNSTHPNGINTDRPEGMDNNLLLLVKSPAYFEFTKEQLCESRRALSDTNMELHSGNLPADCKTRHPGLIRQYVNTPAFIIYTKGAPIYYYNDDVYINDWIAFDGPEAAGFLESLNIPLNTLTLLSSYTELSALIRELRSEFHQTGSHHDQIIDARLKTILYKYSDIFHLEIRLSDKLKAHRARFYEIRNGIYGSFPKKTVSELAQEASLSVSYFQHIYKELFGVSVVQDIIKSRIERACYLLTVSQSSIAEVAEACGYENVEHFIRQFKEITGFTPNKYRGEQR